MPRGLNTATQVGAAQDYLARQAETVNTYFELDKARKIYTYYTWLRIDRQLTSSVYIAQARLQNTVNVPAPTPALSRIRVDVRAPNPSNGQFIFTFTTARRPDGTADLRLVQVETLKDDSIGSTRWYFDVLVDNALQISLPEGRYDDAPGKRVQQITGKTTTLKSATPFRLTVSGYKPKDFKKA